MVKPLAGAQGKFQIEFRDDGDQCNLCGIRTALTEDHLIPKTVPLPRIYNVHSLVKPGAMDIRKRSARQGYPRTRSLCRSCNGQTIGSSLDKDVFHFFNAVNRDRKSRLITKKLVGRFSSKAAMRGIAGHLIGAWPAGLKAPSSDMLRSFVQHGFIDPNLQILIWKTDITEFSITGMHGLIDINSGGQYFNLGHLSIGRAAVAFFDSLNGIPHPLSISKKIAIDLPLPATRFWSAIEDLRWPTSPRKHEVIRPIDEVTYGYFAVGKSVRLEPVPAETNIEIAPTIASLSSPNL